MNANEEPPLILHTDPRGREWKIYFIEGRMIKEPLEHLTRCGSYLGNECDCYTE